MRAPADLLAPVALVLACSGGPTPGASRAPGAPGDAADSGGAPEGEPVGLQPPDPRAVRPGPLGAGADTGEPPDPDGRPRPISASVADATLVCVGAPAGDGLGYTLVDAGDLDGDGVRDWAMGAPEAGRSASAAGEVWVVPADTEGAVHTDTVPTLVTGTEAGQLLGWSLAAPGDVDADGVADLWVSGAADGGLPAAWLLRGGPAGLDAVPDAAATFTPPTTIGETGPTPRLGAGDVDGDGVADLLVGAPTDDTAGWRSGTAWLLMGPHAGARSEADADLQLVGRPDDWLGGQVQVVGDLDGDGVSELLVSGSVYGTSSVWVVSGDERGAAPIRDVARFRVRVVPGAWTRDFAGPLGDADGDGRAEIWVAALGGAEVAIFGDEGDAEREVITAVDRIVGPTDSRFGSGAAAVGDVDGDGKPDLAISAPSYGEGGAVFVVPAQPVGTVRAEEVALLEISVGTTARLAPPDDPERSPPVHFPLAAAPGSGDGLPDLVVGVYSDGDPRLLPSTVYGLRLDRLLAE